MNTLIEALEIRINQMVELLANKRTEQIQDEMAYTYYSGAIDHLNVLLNDLNDLTNRLSNL